MSEPEYVEVNQSPNNQIIIRKSNNLVVSKHNSTLMENILVSIGLSRMHITKEGDVIASIYPREITRIMGSDPRDDNLYTKLKKVAKSITGHPMVIEDGNGNFSAFSLVKTATYVNGTFTITFHEHAKPLITNLKNNFTTMNLLTLSRFKSNFSFRLYEILLKEAYRIPPEPGAYVEVTYNVSELRFMLSVANVEEERVRKELQKYKREEDIDWDRLYELTAVKKIDKWNNFKDRVIEKARKEMQEKADLCFDYECIRKGREGFKFIKFRIYFNTPTNPIENYGMKEKILLNQDGHQYDLDEINHPELFNKYLGHNGLTSQDLKILLMHADGNEQIVTDAITMADKQENIYNYVGWLIACIKRNFEKPTHVVEGSSEDAKVFDEIRSEMDKKWSEPSFNEALWEKVKKEEYFEDFMASIQMDIMTLETILSPQNRIELYFEFKRKNLEGRN